jgi:hypothetical protein
VLKVSHNYGRKWLEHVGIYEYINVFVYFVNYFIKQGIMVTVNIIFRIPQRHNINTEVS